MEVLIFLGVLLTAIFIVVVPLSFGWVINDLITHNSGEAELILLFVLAYFLVQAPVSIGKEYLTARLGTNVTNDIRFDMFEHLQRLSASFYFRNRPGDITSRFYGDLILVNLALTRTLPSLVSSAVTFAVGLITIMSIEWKLGLLVVLMVPLIFVIPRLLSSRASRLAVKQQMSYGMVDSTLQESVRAQQLVKAYNLQPLMLSRFRAQLDRLGESMTRGTFFTVLPGTSGILIMGLIQVLALVVGTLLVLQGTFEVGGLTTFQLLVGAVTGPMMSLNNYLKTLLAGYHLDNI